MLPSQQGYDRAITVFSPDGRLYQVEYAIETVRRGTVAVGIRCADGVVIAVEERTRKLQVSNAPQKIFQIDDHVGVAAAGYIPDARSQVDNARFFSQSNRIIYDEPVSVETIAKHLADQSQQYTQYGGVRPFGVALILGGITGRKPQIFLTDPSGTYISYDAVAIGAGSDRVTQFLEKHYSENISVDDASALSVAGIHIASEDKAGTEHIRMAHIKSSDSTYRDVTADEVAAYAEAAKKSYQSEEGENGSSGSNNSNSGA